MCKLNTVNNTIYIAVIIFISLAVYKTLMQIHVGNFEELSAAAHGVLEGKPHWRAYQNRLLGPYIVYLISLIGISYLGALKVYILIMITFQNIILFTLMRKIEISPRTSISWVIIFSFIFVMVQHRWFYTWDSLDVVIFTFFAFGIFQSKSLNYFLVLFFIGLLNRESALFISLYIVIDSFYFESIKKIHLKSTKKLIIGICLIVFGIIYIKVIRDYLFISQINGAFDKDHEIIGNHIYLIKNIKDLFLHNIFTLNIINSAFILGSISYFVYFVRSYEDSQIKGLIIYCAIIANILIFGLLNETRMYIILIPFILFFEISKNNLIFASSRGANSAQR